MTAPVYGRSAIVTLPAGLDPARFQATLLVDRKDGRPLSKADRDALAAVLAQLAAPEDKPAAKPARKVAAKGKTKAPRKATSNEPRKARAPARKAARRPSKG